jgi:acyl-CoA synthetase (AMP-forming)/AMP-acid ligase II
MCSGPIPALLLVQLTNTLSQVMKGYFKRPTETAEIIDSDGWLHSGDLGYYDKEGHFYVVDRLKEMIKVKSYQLSAFNSYSNWSVNAVTQYGATYGTLHL